MLSEEELESILSARQKAMPGQWYVSLTQPVVVIRSRKQEPNTAVMTCWRRDHLHDAEFIVKAANYIAELVQDVIALRTVVDMLLSFLELPDDNRTATITESMMNTLRSSVGRPMVHTEKETDYVQPTLF